MMTHADLVKCAARWLRGYGKNCKIVITEMATKGEEPDAIGWNCSFTTMVECKVSRADFKRDAKKWFRMRPEVGMGAHRYLLAPKNVLELEDTPPGWGLLEPCGKSALVRFESKCFLERNWRAEMELLISALRRIGFDLPPNVGCKVYRIQKEVNATVGVLPFELNCASQYIGR